MSLCFTCFVWDFNGSAPLCALLLIHLHFCKIAGSSPAALYNKVTTDNLRNILNFHVECLTKNNIRRLSKGKKKKKDNMVFSPSPHWMLCTGPSFDINWVKQEGGREGGQQLDPAVNVTLVGQLHPCQSLLLFQAPLFHLFTPLISVVKMLLWGTRGVTSLMLRTCSASKFSFGHPSRQLKMICKRKIMKFDMVNQQSSEWLKFFNLSLTHFVII